MPSPRPSAEAQINTDADAALARMGYTSELPRNLSMLSVLGLSFAIMAAPFGLSTTLYITLVDGQSVTILWGWILVTLISIAIAASLAEICAVYPTAGGVYYWSAMLSTREWAPLMSFIDGWLTLVGNWTVTLSINFSGGELILSAISLWREDFVPTTWQTILMFWAVMFVCALVNIFCSRYLDIINKVCIYWTASSVVIILVTLLSMADHRRSGEFVFGHYDASSSGWPSGWAFFVGLLQAAYTLTGYGMVAAMCEEVQNPHLEVPRAIVLSVVAAGITGVLYLIPILFTLPSVDLLLSAANSQPIGLLFKTVTGSAGGGFGLLFLILGIMLFAGIGALTAASRCTYAFARDGAIPGFRAWQKVNKRLDVPVNAIILSATVDCLLGLIYFGSSAAFNSFTGVATICLSTSYGLPILISVIRGRRAVRHSSFSLGRFGYAINIATICWIVLAVVLFCMPVSLPVTASSMNYASVVFAGFALISVIWYFIYARKKFKGPPVMADQVDDVVDVDVTESPGVIVDAGADASGEVAEKPAMDNKLEKSCQSTHLRKMSIEGAIKDVIENAINDAIDAFIENIKIPGFDNVQVTYQLLKIKLDEMLIYEDEIDKDGTTASVPSKNKCKKEEQE